MSDKITLKKKIKEIIEFLEIGGGPGTNSYLEQEFKEYALSVLPEYKKTETRGMSMREIEDVKAYDSVFNQALVEVKKNINK